MFNFEFQIIDFIQNFRNPLLDIFFVFLNFFDTGFFYVLLIPLIWIGYNRKLGIRLFFIILLSAFVNDLLKNIFMMPRPCDIDPTVGLITITNYSFPSGAAQNAILLPLVFINHFKNKKYPIVIGCLYFIFISFSRMYLGVHFLSDLIGGWIVGILLFLIYLYIFPKIETLISKKPVLSFWLSQGILLALIFISKFTQTTFLLLGISLGLFLSYEFNMFLNNTKSFIECLKRYLLVILGILVIYYFHYFFNKRFTFLSLNFTFYLMGFWMSFLCSFVYKKLFLKKQK